MDQKVFMDKPNLKVLRFSTSSDYLIHSENFFFYKNGSNRRRRSLCPVTTVFIFYFLLLYMLKSVNSFLFWRKRNNQNSNFEGVF